MYLKNVYLFFCLPIYDTKRVVAVKGRFCRILGVFDILFVNTKQERMKK